MFKVKKKYYLVFVLRVQNSYEWIKKKRFRPAKIGNTVRFKGNTYIINPNVFTFSKGIKYYLAIDIEKGQVEEDLEDRQIKYTAEKIIDPKIADLIMGKSIIAQILSSLGEKVLGSKIMLLIVGAVAGFGIGWITYEIVMTGG